MSRRAIPGLIVVVLGLASLIWIGRSSDEQPVPSFASTSLSWMPSVGSSGSLSGSWFCPGVPVTGEDGVGGERLLALGPLDHHPPGAVDAPVAVKSLDAVLLEQMGDAGGEGHCGR